MTPHPEGLVRVPNVFVKGVGKLFFPDDMGDEAIQGVLSKQFGTPSSPYTNVSYDEAADFTDLIQGPDSKFDILSKRGMEDGALPDDISIRMKGSTAKKNGVSARNIGDGVYRINRSSLDDSNRGRGFGVDMYVELIEYAESKGYKIVSDDRLQEDAVHIYDALKRRGYDVSKNPAATTGSKGSMSSKDGPVFSISKKLDMSTDARMARAKEQGFDVDSPQYHGTGGDIEEFDMNRTGATDESFYGEGVYQSSDPADASGYAISAPGDPNVIKTYVRNSNPYVKPSFATHGSDWKDVAKADGEKYGFSKSSTPAEKTKKLEEAGFTGVVVKMKGDDGKLYDFENVVFDPANVRSVNAAFSAAKTKSANLLASAAPVAVGLGALYTPEENAAQASPYMMAGDALRYGRPDTIQVEEYPYMESAANFLDQYAQTPAGPLLQGTSDYMRNIGRDKPARQLIKDAFGLASDYM